MKNWVNVFKTGRLVDAELIKTILIDHGIDAVVVNRIDSSILFGEATVYCPQEHETEAKQIIKTTKSIS